MEEFQSASCTFWAEKWSTVSKQHKVWMQAITVALSEMEDVKSIATLSSAAGNVAVGGAVM
jgi:hypothetical protein